MNAALHDTEQCLIGAGLGSTAAVGPARGAIDGLEYFFAGFAGWRAFIETHDEVCPERFLNLHGAFGGQFEEFAVDMRTKDDAVIVELAKVGQTEHLKATTVCQNRPIPVHETVQAPVSLHDGFARSEGKVVGVGEQHLGAGFAELCRKQSLDGADGADGHEGRSLYGAVRSLQLTGSTRGSVIDCVKVKGERGHLVVDGRLTLCGIDLRGKFVSQSETRQSGRPIERETVWRR